METECPLMCLGFRPLWIIRYILFFEEKDHQIDIGRQAAGTTISFFAYIPSKKT